MLQFPISPRSRLCNGRLSFELARQLAEPFEEFSGPGRAVGRVGFTRADLDRHAVPGVDENESILVGDVVSCKNRPPAGTGEFLEWLRQLPGKLEGQSTIAKS
jgi:hypothetical protein